MIRETYGKKIGMTQIFNQEGDALAVTLLEVEPVCVLAKMSYPGKPRVKIGVFKLDEKKSAKLKKPILGCYKKLRTASYKMIREVEAREEEIKDCPTVGIEIFKEGEFVSVRAKSKGRGFSGGMKRHGWAGQPKSHGSTSHRRIGSAGASAYPSRIIKGIHMPGHMGDKFRTISNLKVFKIDPEKNLLFLEGSIPGARGAIVRIRKSKVANEGKKQSN